MQWEWFDDEHAAGRWQSPVEQRTPPAGVTAGPERPTTSTSRRSPPAPPPPAPTTTGDAQADKIQHLSDLHDSGALTDEEFAAAKAKALGI